MDDESDAKPPLAAQSSAEDGSSPEAGNLPEFLQRVRERTPARLLVGRKGAAYRTETQLALREAHAAARDAVRSELATGDAVRAESEAAHAVRAESAGHGFDPALVQRFELFDTRTRARSKDEYLLRPGLGRQFDRASRAEIKKSCAPAQDLQIVIGDGLSVPAVIAQVPPLLPLLFEGATARGWTLSRAFLIHHCRVGILNEIGELLNPRVVVLLIGERPGLATAESLSAYMAYQPRASHTDANRNLISNIHARGLTAADAATRILSLAAQMMHAGISGCTLREATGPAAGPAPALPPPASP
jgi:ethanolamine ammonia-lyase small subunit